LIQEQSLPASTVAPLDEVKKLLDGTLDPSILESKPELYDMAESIYGRDALDQLGVEAPERPPDTILKPNGDSKHEVQMPSSSLPTPVQEEMPAKKRNIVLFSISALILALLMANLVIGIGSIVPICDSPDSETPCDDKLNFSSISDYESPDAWSETMTIEIIDAIGIILCTAMMVLGLRKR